MRAVFDTNITISGRLWSGAPHSAIEAAEHGQVQLLISEVMLDELRDVLRRPKFAARLSKLGKTADQVIAKHLKVVEIVEPADISPLIEADPDDNSVLACALGGTADCIVTGDDHLLNLGEYQSIPIWDVAAFLHQLKSNP